MAAGHRLRPAAILVVACATSLVVIGCGTPREGPPEPIAPVAVPGPARTALVGEVLVFDSSASTDEDGLIVETTWYLGDGTSTTAPAFTHAYEAPGGYVVSLTVVDDDGLEGRAETVVTVEEVALAAHVTTAPEAPRVLDPVTFDAAGSTSALPLVAWRWSFGDGASGEGEVVEHVYEEAGIYGVLLTIEDLSGATADLLGYVEVLPLDVSGTWTVTPDAASYGCQSYAASFDDTELSFSVGAGGELTATSSMGRTYSGTLDGAAFTLTGTYVGATGGSCVQAPVSATLVGMFTGPSAFTATASAYYDLSVPCQCSASFEVVGAR